MLEVGYFKLMTGPVATSSEGPFELECQTLGALPIVGRFLERMRVGALLERYLAPGDARGSLPAARAVGVLVRNLCVCHEPLYGLGEWAAGYDPRLLGLTADELSSLNDDRVGRALDRLFAADRGSFLTELTLGVISAFDVDCSQLHNDSTSITLHGAYRTADGRERAGKATPAIVPGHNKDHRPDLKQLLWILTIAADEAVPVAYRLADGNLSDDQTHVKTWDGLCALTGRSDFLYVADSKLATREQMRHIDAHRGRFLTLLPRSRNEDRVLRDWMRDSEPRWSEAARRPAARNGDADEVWTTAPAPIRSTEGYRILWVHSTIQHRLDHHLRAQRLDRAHAALNALNDRLHGPKCRFADRHSVQAAIDRTLAKHDAAQLIAIEIINRPAAKIRQDYRGPDNKRHRRRILRARFALTWHTNPQTQAHQAAADGCYPLITNDHTLTDPEILAAYRYQPNLEKRHHQLKSIQHATPVFLKNPARIESLFLCHYIALLCCCLIERELRQAMAREQLPELALYPEHRACQQPTAARTLQLFAGLTRHQLTHHHQPIQTFQPQLTPLQTQLLDLLNLPPTTYTTT
jgi:transposase